MARLIVAMTALALAWADPARADPIDRWRPLIAEASLRFGVPSRWIERVLRAESASMTTLNGRPIRSRAGAMGLMQLMPATWAEMRARLSLGDNPDDPRDNILAGTLYLRLMYDRFGYPGLFAAYNAGPDRYADYLAGRGRLPGETIAYLVTVGGSPQPAKVAPQRALPTLFAVRRADDSTSQIAAEEAWQPSLFAIHRSQP